ncbi:MAG: ATP-binding protein [Thermoanaerobaculia bacterium]
MTRPTRRSPAVKDVAGHKRVEEEVRHSEQRIRALIENAIDAIYVLNPDGTVLEVNRAAEMLQGRPRAEIIGSPLMEAVSPEEREKVGKAFQETLSHGSIHGLETLAFRADGKSVPIEISASVVQVGDRHLVNAIVRDVSARHQTEEQLRQSQRMEAIGQLAGGVAHDFNNLLTVIIGYTELLALRADIQAAARGEIGEIRNAAERAAVLTRQLLTFSRKQVLEPVVFSINELIVNLEKMLGRLIGEHLNLVTRLDPFLGNVCADRGQLELVIMNLAVNARDAMPNGGRLTIETANADLDGSYAQGHVTVQPGPYVMVAVSDTGTGMDAETQARIFEPFFTTKEKGKGTGLGLSTVYGIVKQSEGNIWVYSEPGKGTTFKVYLPRVDESLLRPASKTLPAATVDGHETILVVEDDAAIRALTRQILEKYGYRVLDAPNGSEAERLVTGHPEKIDLLLTDLVMPDMAGTELATRLLAKRPGLRVVLMSGYTDHAIDRNGLLESGRAFLQKPFTPAMLLRKIRDVLT